MTALKAQPTAAMTRKQFWTTMSAGSVTLGFWVLDAFLGISAEPVVVGIAVGMSGAAVGYLVKDRVLK